MAGKAEDIYAESLFDVALEEEKLDVIYQELTAAAQILREHSDFVRLLSSPAVTRREKVGLIANVFDGRTDVLLSNFLKILVQNGRIVCFDEIRTAFERCYHKEKNILSVTAVTAIELSPVLREKLCKKLEGMTRKTIVLTEKVDPAVLGGILLQYDSKEIDGTVRERLNGLKRQIACQIV